MPINTFTLRKFDPCNPDSDSIVIEDIAHALSMTARSGGHFPTFYSVARHCVMCALEAEKLGYDRRVQLLCLLHDGSEAYLQDITSPVKKNLPDYLEYEKVLQDKIYLKFSGKLPDEEEIRKINKVDRIMLYNEFRDIMGVTLQGDFSECLSEIDRNFYGFDSDEKKYLDFYNKLT